MAIDNDDNLYITSEFWGTVQFGNFTLTCPLGTDRNDVFIAKMTSTGNWLWAAQIIGTWRTYARDIDVDSSGECYITGYYHHNITVGNTTLTGNWDDDVFVAKLDTNGSWIWAKKISSSDDDDVWGIEALPNGICYVAGRYNYHSLFVKQVLANGDFGWTNTATGTDCSIIDLAIDAVGNSYVTGYFNNSLTWGYIQIETNATSPFIAKLNSSGVCMWAKRLDSTWHSYFDSYVNTDSSGNAYFLGCFEHIWQQQNVALINNGNCETYVAKFSSSGTPLWATKSNNLICQSSGNGIALNSSERVWITGSFDGTSYFNGQLTSSIPNGGNDIWVAKKSLHNPAINNWSKTAGGFGDDQGNDVVCDNSNNSYITGYFSETTDFHSNMLTSYGGRDIFVSKLDEQGNWLWTAQAGGIDDEFGSSIDLDSQGNVFIIGSFHGTAIFGNTTLFSSGDSDVFIAKLSNDGDWLWAIKAGGDEADSGYGLVVDSGGLIYITGAFTGSAQFGNLTLESSGLQDIFIALLNTNGILLQAISAGGAGEDMGSDIQIDNSGNILVTGVFSDNALFGNHQLSSNGGLDFFVYKLSSNFNPIWSISEGGISDDHANGITSSGNSIYITGDFQGLVTIGNTSINSQGQKDIFTCKVDSNGNWVYTISAGGVADDKGKAIAEYANGDAIVTGLFSGEANYNFSFGQSIWSSGQYEAFIGVSSILVHNEDEVLPISTIHKIHTFPNPFSKSTTIKYNLQKAGKVSLKIYNTKGQLVKTFTDNLKKAGDNTETWYADSDSHEKLSSGVYFIRLQQGNETKTSKVLYIK